MPAGADSGYGWAGLDVTHPNLVALYGLHAEGRVWFFTLKWIPGVPFFRCYRSANPR